MAAWKTQLLNTLKANEGLGPVSKFFQLATVRKNNRPANRTMVYRGFLPDTDKITFTTDHRTEKLEEFGHQSWAEICWYFPDSREQFRIGGQLASVDENTKDEALLKERQEAWNTQSSNTKKWHAQPKPGTPAVDNSEPQKEYETEKPLAEFVLVVMEPDSVDYLALKENKRISWTSEPNGSGRSWHEQALNP